MGIVIQPDTLANWLKKQDITILDVRSNLQNPDAGEKAYEQAHLPGAQYFHLKRDLSGKEETHGGPHPLPDETSFTKKLQKAGIRKNKPVVIYDTNNDMFAARAWWLLNYYGHDQTYILDGGYKAWVAAGYEVTNQLPEVRPSDFSPDINRVQAVAMEEVRNRTKEVLIDSRSKARYIGESEPLYQKAGHIPGAKNYFWQEVLTDDGIWRTPEQLQEHFSGLDKDETIIVSCGSGISACPNIVALKQAGFEHVKLYPGSFSDWISYEENPVKKGEEG